MKKAVILGGSSGLGLELTREAMARGITPIVLGRNPPNIPVYRDDVSYYVNLADSISVGGCAARVGLWWDEETRYFIWNAGVLEVRPLNEIKNPQELMNVNYVSPVRIIRSLVAFVKMIHVPLHLVVVSSTSSWKARKYQADYCGTKAAQAHFSRALAIEFRDDIPGSKVTLVKPAGMNTGLFDEAEGFDTAQFMNPKDAAQVIWDEALRQRKFFQEFQIDRSGGKPVLVRRNFASIIFE